MTTQEQSPHTLQCSNCESAIESNELTDFFTDSPTLICKMCVAYRDNPSEFVKAAKEIFNASRNILGLAELGRQLHIEAVGGVSERSASQLRKIILLEAAIARAEAAFGKEGQKNDAPKDDKIPSLNSGRGEK